mgnify:CR=1 FL=1
MLAVMGAVVLFVAVNVIKPVVGVVPLAANPIAVLSFVQEYVLVPPVFILA